MYKFKAFIQKHPSLNAGYIEFPYDVRKEFGVQGQVKVKATFDGYEYRGSLVKMGRHCHWIGITQKIRDVIGKHPGDNITVTIERDMEKRSVVAPADPVRQLKKNENLLHYFKSLSYTYQKEYVQWIEEAKKPETRKRRIDKSLQMLAEQKKEPH